MDRPPRFAIVIPARNEAAILARKIAGTHGMRFPPLPPGLAHLAVVVDDHSSDGTAARAREAVAALAPRHDLEWRVIENGGPAGKGAALRAGFEEAAGYDVLVLTDVDAMVARDAPLLTAAALADPRVGAVTGTQRYVDAIGETWLGAPRGDAYDAASETVRRLESRAGALFSVHGPWFAIRAAAGARPEPGVAADDLDLALQVRERGYRVVLHPGLPFWEVKPSGEALRAQRLRRARAYFEVMDRHLPRCLRIAPVPLGTLQFLAYAAAPPLLAAGLLGLAAWPTWRAATSGGSPAIVIAAALATAGVLVLAPFQAVLRYALVILAARVSRHRTAADRWQSTAR